MKRFRAKTKVELKGKEILTTRVIQKMGQLTGFM